MEIENMLRNIPKFNASPMFKDQLHDRLVTEIADREQTRWRFGWKPAWAVVSLVIIVGFGSIFLKNYFGRDFLRPSTVMAAEIVKKSLESFFREGTIYHQITKQFLEDKTEPIVYELWEDNDTPRFLNHVTYPASVYPPDGQESWQGFFIETKENYWWEVNINEKVVRRENYIYSKEEDRWLKSGEKTDLPKIFNDLIEKGILETKEGRLDKREVYVVYDTRTDPDKYWDILTFDKNTFQLLRTEKYEGEGDKRKLTSLVEYELQESVPATPDNIDKFFKSYPIATEGFKYLVRDYYVNEDRDREEFKEIISETPDPTANWKIYTDTKNNFSLRYPKNLVSKTSGEKLYLYIEGVTPTESETFVPNLTIGNKYKKPENLTNLISWAESNRETFPNLTKDSEVTLGNNKFTTFESDSGPSAYLIHYLINDDVNIYDFSVRIVGSNEGAGKQLSEYLPQILSTFKFLDENISKDEAVNSVRSLNEVQGFLESVPSGIVEFDHESEDKQLWVIHVYEVKDDHTATFNWYEVDKKNGKITKMFN